MQSDNLTAQFTTLLCSQGDHAPQLWPMRRTWEPVGAAFQLPYSFHLECAHDAEAFAKDGESWKIGKSLDS